MTQLKPFTAVGSDLILICGLIRNGPPANIGSPATGHILKGANVLYMDGSVSYVPYGIFKKNFELYDTTTNSSSIYLLKRNQGEVAASGGVWLDFDNYHR